MQPTPRRFRFGAELRLRSKLQFDAIYAGGRRIDDRFFGLRVKPNGLTHPRIGLAVAVKTAGNAVARNRLRRQIKESFRLVQHELPSRAARASRRRHRGGRKISRARGTGGNAAC